MSSSASDFAELERYLDGLHELTSPEETSPGRFVQAKQCIEDIKGFCDNVDSLDLGKGLMWHHFVGWQCPEACALSHCGD